MPSLPPSLTKEDTRKGRASNKDARVLTVLVTPVPCPVHSAVWEDPQEVAPVAAVEKLGLLVVLQRQIEPLGQGRERGDFPLSHGSAAAGEGALKTVRN